jgi:hypothetical protein
MKIARALAELPNAVMTSILERFLIASTKPCSHRRTSPAPFVLKIPPNGLADIPVQSI